MDLLKEEQKLKKIALIEDILREVNSREKVSLALAIKCSALIEEWKHLTNYSEKNVTPDILDEDPVPQKNYGDTLFSKLCDNKG
jgi:hypothetical protein